VKKVLLLSAIFILCAPFSWVGADEIAPGDAKVACSLNNFFCATSDPQSKVTTVYRRRAGGVKEALWSMSGYFPVIFLSNDGEYIVTGFSAGGVLPLNYKPTQVLLSFFDRGRLINEVRLNELVRDLSKMPKVSDQYHWGGYLGLNADDHFTVQIFDQSWALFDAKTGQPIK